MPSSRGTQLYGTGNAKCTRKRIFSDFSVQTAVPERWIPPDRGDIPALEGRRKLLVCMYVISLLPSLQKGKKLKVTSASGSAFGTLLESPPSGILRFEHQPRSGSAALLSARARRAPSRPGQAGHVPAAGIRPLPCRSRSALSMEHPKQDLQ